MRKAAYIILGIVLAIGIAAACWQRFTAPPTVEGVAQLKPVKAGPYSISPEAASFSYSSGRPQELIDLPEGISETSPDIQFFRLPVGGRPVHVLVEYLSDTKARAWLDTNLDNSLSDENAISGVLRKKRRLLTDNVSFFDFGIVNLSIDSVSRTFHLTQEQRSIAAWPTHYMLGAIRLGEDAYHIALTDGDFDGRFQTLFSPASNPYNPGCDGIMLNLYSRALLKNLDTARLVPLGRYYEVNKLVSDRQRFYSVSVSADGKTVEMAPAEPPMGTLQIGSGNRFAVQLFSDAVSMGADFTGQISLPAGQYQMHWGELYWDVDDTQYYLSPRFQSNTGNGVFQIEEGRSLTLNLGPPFTVKTSVNSARGGSISIDAVLLGSAGEEYGLRIVQGSREPELIIVSENGETMHRGTMEYG